MYAASTTGVTENIRGAVAAVKAGDKTYSDVARRLKVAPMQARRYASQAVRGGWIVNDETRRGHPAQLSVGEPLPDTEGLPSPETLNTLTSLTGRVCQWRRRREVGGVTTVADILDRLPAIGCRVELSPAGIAVVGAVGRLTADLKAAIRCAKHALVVELLRRKAWELKDFIDGDGPSAERVARMREFMETCDRLAEARTRLFDSWRHAGFTIIWSPLVEEFILVGDDSPPPGSEGCAVYCWAEVETLRDASPERVQDVHRVKKLFGGRVRPTGMNGGSK